MSTAPARVEQPGSPTQADLLLNQELASILAGWSAMTPNAQRSVLAVVEAIVLENTAAAAIAAPTLAMLSQLAQLGEPSSHESAAAPASVSGKPRRQRRLGSLHPLAR